MPEIDGNARFHLAAIIESADDAIISKDLQGTVRSWNHAAYRIFGYTAEEMIGCSILRLIPEPLHYEEDAILSKLRAGERVDHYETRRITKKGEVLDVSVTISPIKDESGCVIGASKIVRNISDRKQMERILVQSEKLAVTGRMAATIAHEINNPLESLMNLIYLAREASPKKSEARQYLLTAESELKRVAHIARRTLGYYRDSAKPMPVDLPELIETVLAVYDTKLQASGIVVDRQIDHLQKIVVNSGEMVQVFSNIIMNAIDAMTQGGMLHISARQTSCSSKEGILTTIRDQGTGIDQTDLESVFEPFFTTKGESGTGIGLWVAKQLVEKRGGEITITSQTQGRNSGTSVMIFLPFAVPALQVLA